MLAFWIIMAAVVAIVANARGRSAGIWFLYGLLLWPIALVHILVTPPDATAEEVRRIGAGGKKCPECAEIVKADAKVCRFCGNREFFVTRKVQPQRTLYDRLVWDRTQDPQ